MGTLSAVAKHAQAFLNARAYKPAHLRVGIRDLFDLRQPEQNLLSNRKHIELAVEWLTTAQDATPDGGVAARYRFSSGWAASYPETTGYIIPTFYACAAFLARPDLRERAGRMAEWLIGVQLANGAFPGHQGGAHDQPRVFNTAQVLLGLVHAFREHKENRYLHAADRAGEWLMHVQESDGSWLKYTFHNRKHAYHSCVAWPLLELYLATRNETYRSAAEKCLSWVIECQQENGWFNRAGFGDDAAPFLHTIGYIISGLLESAAILTPDRIHESPYFQAGLRASEALLHRFEIRRYMAAQYDANWKSPNRQSCLTGNVQTAHTWLRIYQFTGDPRFLNGALKLTDFVKSTQDFRSAHPGIRGGIKGSHPIWGDYIRYSYPNWAAKFFIDALLLEENVLDALYRAEGLA